MNTSFPSEWPTSALLALFLVSGSAIAAPSSLGAALKQACLRPVGALVQACDSLYGPGALSNNSTLSGLMPYQFLPRIAIPLKIWPKQISLRTPAHATEDEGAVEWRGGGSGDFADSPFGYFAQAKYQSGAHRRAPAEFKADAYTLTLGGDYRFSERLLVGLAAIYGRQETFLKSNPGHMGTDAYRAALFGNYYLPQAFYVDWLATYSHHRNTLERVFNLGGIERRAESQPNTDLYSFALTLGRDTAWRDWVFTNYMRVEYMNLHSPTYSERGGYGLAYQSAGYTDESLTLSPGIQISRTIGMGWGVLTPALRFEYEHQFKTNNRPINLRLAEAPAGTGDFVLYSGAPDRDYFNLGGSVAATLAGGGAVFLRYEARLGQADISNHIVEAGFRLGF